MAAVVFSLMLHKCISAAGCVYDETVAFTSSCLLSGSLSGSVCFCSVLGRRCISLILLSSRLALFRSAADPTGLLKATDAVLRSERLFCLKLRVRSQLKKDAPDRLYPALFSAQPPDPSLQPSFNWNQCRFNWFNLFRPLPVGLECKMQHLFLLLKSS